MGDTSMGGRTRAAARGILRVWWPALLFAAGVLAVSGVIVCGAEPAPALGEAPRRGAPRVAVTVDDLPWNGPGYSDSEIAGLTDTLLASLRARGVRATGLVTCRGMRDGAPFLRKWIDSGMELGNHTWSHLDLNATPLDAWLDDARRCDRALREVVGGPVRWFRYPMLHQGADPAVRDSVARTLTAWGYANAHVTIDNSEWLLARAYDMAMRAGEPDAAAAVVDAYRSHLREAARHFRDVARAKFDRDVGHVLLVHANALAARHLGSVIDSLRADGFEIAELEEVLSDPIYSRVDEYVGPSGLSWIYRAAPFGPVDPWDDAAEEALRARFRWQ